MSLLVVGSFSQSQHSFVPTKLSSCLRRLQESARRQAEQDEPGEDGRPKKRGRGRPLGSKTKPRPEDELGPADTVEVSVQGLH